jgi:hypothetical protein
MKVKYEPGLYEVFWEDNKSYFIHRSEVYITSSFTDKLKFEFDIISNFKDFRCFSSRMVKPYQLIRKKEYHKRTIAIVSYDDEYGINNLINEGYSIREFIKDKCIMENKSKTVI